ncbi:MAG: FAD-binding oxidoreductase, partial [Alphaproteobacteria bacterium]
MEKCDFLIIGAGIAGASAGYELAAHGRVIVLEREDQPGYHSTGRSAAVYSESYGNRVVRAITSAGRAFFEAPPAGFAEGPLLSPRGFLFIARTDQRDSLDTLLGDAEATAAPVHPLDAAAARALVPILDPGYVAAAAAEPAAMDMDVHAIHQGFLRGLRARGGRIVARAEVRGLARIGEDWRAETTAGVFAAPVVVNAAGAWADEIAGLAGVRPVGLVPKRRTAFVFDPPQDIPGLARWPVVVDVNEQFYFKPDAGRLLGSP